MQEFCVDVSTYQPVIWVERDGQVKKKVKSDVLVSADVICMFMFRCARLTG